MAVSFLSPTLYWLLNLGVCQLYPGYKTFLYLYGRHLKGDKLSDQPSLSSVYYAHHFLYWAVYLLYSFLESLLPFLKFVPFYFELKLLFFFWLGSDHFKGAGFLFHRYLNKAFSKFSENLKRHLKENYDDKTRSMFKELANNLGFDKELDFSDTKPPSRSSTSSSTS